MHPPPRREPVVSRFVENNGNSAPLQQRCARSQRRQEAAQNTPSSMCDNSAYEPATPVWAWEAARTRAPARANALALPHPAHSGPQTRRERCHVSSSRRAEA
jgi:hypothetical protein